MDTYHTHMHTHLQDLRGLSRRLAEDKMWLPGSIAHLSCLCLFRGQGDGSALRL